MREFKIDLVRKTIDCDAFDAAKKELIAAKNKGDVVRRFETRFSEKTGSRQCFAVNSGTNAVFLALQALQVGNADEVIVPSYTCLTLYYAIKAVGATPVLVDNNFHVGQMDFNVSISAISEAVSDKTKAILVPSMFGVCADIEKIKKKTGLPVIEDATQALGAVSRDGKAAGSMGDLAVFSFNGKMISTGEGGMLCVNKTKNPAFVDSIKDFEKNLNLVRTEKSRQKIIELMPASYLNFSMSDLQAAIALSELKKLGWAIKRRIEIANYYAEQLNLQPDCKPLIKTDRSNVFFRFIVRVHQDVEGIIRQLQKKRIEMGRGVYPPIHYIAPGDAGNYPNAEKCIRSLLSIPIHEKLSNVDIAFIAGKFNGVLQ
jgi:dTDP-4-amino-4,6-dideoxygalactose transaminase